MISSFKPGLLLVYTLLSAGLLMGAEQRYLTFFSAEQGNFRRLVIDGLNNRQVTTALDSVGAVTVRIRDVEEEDYIGRRVYKKGYLIPVEIRVDFEEKKWMAIHISGARFRDVVRFRVVGSDVYVIDMFKDPLPTESYFLEETVSTFWPGGRFQPDIGPSVRDSILIEASSRPPVHVAGTIVKRLVPYRRILKKAVVWAGSVSGILCLSAIPLIVVFQRRRAAHDESTVEEERHTPPLLPEIPLGADPEKQAREVMRRNDHLSYDEATLLVSLRRQQLREGTPKGQSVP